MKAKELMIGDLVRTAKDVCFYKGTIVQVRSIDGDNRFLEKNLIGCATCIPIDDPDKMSWGVWVEYLEPIPLTPEILEKNEFHFGFTSNEEDMAYAVGTSLHKEDEGWVWDEGDGAIKVIFPNESDGGEVKLEGSNYLAYVFDEIYVHQLQHLIRLSGIDKEIAI